MQSEQKRVLEVGSCSFDHAGISAMLEGNFDVRVDRAHGVDDALQQLREGRYALVLVNRRLDADGSPGLGLVTRMKADAALRDTPVMVVSNYPEAQDEAVAAGAVRGFGKNALHSPSTAEMLAAQLGPPRGRPGGR